jgi:acyl dehydratase
MTRNRAGIFMSRSGRYTVRELSEMAGQELGVTRWINVDQGLIDQFGAATLDLDWVHVDPELAKTKGPFGGTIAFGFWTLSMLTYFSHDVGMWPEDVALGLNYGLDRVRWLSPVPIGSRIRNRCALVAFEERGDGRFLIRTSNTIEIEGGKKPALVAEWLGLFVMSGDGAGDAAGAGPMDAPLAHNQNE